MEQIEAELIKEFKSILIKQEELYRMQRVKDRWIFEGEANTKFFHTSVVSKRARNIIKSLQNHERVWIDDEDQLKRMACVY